MSLQLFTVESETVDFNNFLLFFACPQDKIVAKMNNMYMCFFIFLKLLLTTEAMGIGGLREHSLSWNDKVNAGAKPAK
jgi:hypothetical protein